MTWGSKPPSIGRYNGRAMRILALDVGERRIGVALSDPTGFLATPLTAIERTGGKADFQRIVDLATESEAERILIGIPVSMDGVEREQARSVREFCRRLAGQTGMPIDTLDERLTTVEAERRLRERGASAKERKALVDSAAAAILLQAYLDSGGAGSTG